MEKIDKVDFFIIDDSDVNIYYTEDLLSELDFVNSVETFVEATEALAELKQRMEGSKKLPHIIILDIRMPEMDGFEFLEELEELFDNQDLTTKIFMLTSSMHRRDIESFEKQNLACEYLSKPLEKQELLKKIQFHFS